MEARDVADQANQGVLQLKSAIEDIANVVGTATESCIRILSEFRKEGFIKTSGKRMAIKEEQKLQDLVDGFSS